MRPVAAAVAVLLFAACGGGPTPSPSPAASAPASALASAEPTAGDVSPTALTVFAASPLEGALAQLKASYESGHPGATITVVTDSSATLRTRIEQGAPADVFLAADIADPRELVDGGLADGEAIDFAGNLLTIAVPADNPAKITSPADLARSGVRIVAAGDDVPITAEATQAIALLATIPGYPPNFVTAYARNVVSKEGSVKALLAKIELRAGDAGIVDVTDARASTKVATVDIPVQANVPATYAGVIIRTSAHLAAAHAFLDWIMGAEAQLILTQLGFIQPQT
jgi:molybdate transport system substrate-binding protein